LQRHALTQHIFSPLATYFSDATVNRMDPKLREGFLDATPLIGHVVPERVTL
jgi:TRAP-type C4-dicarboxylate transport system substrate-binding protein